MVLIDFGWLVRNELDFIGLKGINVFNTAHQNFHFIEKDLLAPSLLKATRIPVKWLHLFINNSAWQSEFVSFKLITTQTSHDL
jgi:hypothetical protein